MGADSAAAYIQTRYGTVHAWALGRGPGVVLLPDSPGSAAGLAALLGPLGSSYRLVIIDLPGHGATTIAPDRDDPVGQAAAVVAEVIGRGPVPVVGFGVGAMVAAALASCHPDEVPVAVLAGAPHRAAEPPPAAELQPSDSGGHLLAAWREVRDSSRYRPWWSSRRADMRTGAQPPVAALHAAAVDTLGWVDGHRPLMLQAWASAPPVDGTGAVFVPLDDPVPDPAVLGQVLGRVFSTMTVQAPAALPAGRDAGFGDGRDGPGYLAGLHVRLAGTDCVGTATPVVVLPAAPGSSAVLDPLVDRLALTRPVVAVDYPGHGRTPPLDVTGPGLDDYVEVVGAALHRLDGGPFDLYGFHSGAGVAAELGRRHPHLVRRVVLDGTPLLPADLVGELLERNFVSLDPDLHGSHLARAWGYVMDRSLWWPWYLQDAEHAMPADRPPAPVLHRLTADLLRGAGTYHLLYAAALRHDLTPALEALRQPTLVCGRAADPVDAYRPAVAARVAGSASTAIVARPGEDPVSAVARILTGFLDGPS